MCHVVRFHALRRQEMRVNESKKGMSSEIISEHLCACGVYDAGADLQSAGKPIPVPLKP